MNTFPDPLTQILAGMVSPLLLGLGAGTSYCAKWVGLRTSQTSRALQNRTKGPAPLWMRLSYVNRAFRNPKWVKKLLYRVRNYQSQRE